jgi:hypothetical protein
MMPEVVAVGEAAELTVTVLVPTWFTRPPVYPSFELANAITRQPADNSYPIRERVGSDSWSGIVRSYEVYPLLGATYRLSGQSMSIAYADPGKDPVIMDVELPEIVFRGSVPGGAETLHPYIAGRSLALSLEVDGATDALAAGELPNSMGCQQYSFHRWLRTCNSRAYRSTLTNPWLKTAHLHAVVKRSRWYSTLVATSRYRALS